MIDDYVKRNLGRAKSFISLGQLKYLSAIKNVNIVLGNSSSGLIEVPIFNKPTVNIGDRQKGRLRASSVIDCDENATSISLAIKKAFSKDFQKTLGQVHHPYKSGNASKAISKTLKRFNLDGVLTKEFYDLKL
jgi:GDP/UDP-N,N'-diacetylbacillosamine 2-epimerase (hydrolysing)